MESRQTKIATLTENESEANADGQPKHKTFFTQAAPTMKLIRRFAALLSAVFVALASPSGAAATWYVTSTTLEYAQVGGQSQKLDLHAVHGMPRRGLVVWVHGGAWRAGSRADAPYERFNELGFAVASVDYRLSPVAKFPAQIHDIKGAIRFLRAEAARTKIKAGLKVTLDMIPGAAHGGSEFLTTERREILVKFMKEGDVK